MMNKLFFVCATVLILLSDSISAQEYSWGNVTMGGGGFVSAIITSKTERDVIYARTDVGGAYRWNEAGQSWESITDWIGPDDMSLMGIEALALDPNNPNRVYMLAGTEYWNPHKTMILRSDDYGATFDTINVTDQFKTHGNGYGRQNGERLAVDPNDPDILFCGTRDDGLWKSTDRGTSWTNVAGVTAPSNGLGICFVLFDENRVSSGVTQRIFIGMSTTEGNLFMSDDAGESWELIEMPELSKQVMPQRAVLTPGGRYLYVTAANGAGPGFGNGVTISRGAVLKYDTEEKTWTDISPENWIDDPPDPDYPGQTQWDAHFGGFGGITMNPADSNHIVVSSINAWKPQRWDNSTRAGWGDKIFSTEDGGASWTSVFGDINDSEISDVPDDAPIAVLYKNGYNWIEGESIHWAGSIEFDPFNPERVFVTSGNGIYMADNFSPGERFRWNFTVRGLEETVPMDLVSIPGGPLITVILDYDGFVHSNVTEPVSGSRHSPQMGSTTGIDYAKQNAGVVVRVGGNDKAADHNEYVFPLYYSTDTARTWTRFATHPGPGRNYQGKIAVSSDGEVVLWAPEGKNVVLRTEDWGETWTECEGISHETPIPTADPVNPDVFYAFGGEVYRSTDKGLTFTKAGERNFSWTNDMQVAPGREGHVWVVGFAWDGVNGGFLARSIDGGATFVDIDPQNDSAYTQKVQHAEAVGFGKEAPGADYPAIYIYGTIDGVKGVWQSIDEAKSWTRIDDEMHQFGALANGNFVRGDANTFGVVYKSTAGRGIAVRMPSGWVDDDPVSPVAVSNKVRTRQAWISDNSLVLNTADGLLNVKVYSLNGRLVSHRTFTQPAKLNVGSLVKAKGTYIVSVVKNSDKVILSRVFSKVK
ncbi:MAG: T9SS type A sorting domain-containing protein [Chitinispirillaceae bacterium]